MSIKKRHILLCLILLMATDSLRAQLVDYAIRVDTFSVGERTSVRTNGFDWMLLTPNIGVEYDVRKTNWGKWAVGINLFSNFHNKHTYKQGIVYNRSGVRLETKNFWRSNRTEKVKLWTQYRGAYASFTNYSMMMGGKHGWQGNAFSAGLMYGVERQLYVYQNGNSLDLELGASVGVVATKNDQYALNREHNEYEITKSRNMHIVPFPVPTELRIGFIYRFGHKQADGKTLSLLDNRYHKRIEIDTHWADSLRDDAMRKEYQRREAEERKQFVKDSTELIAPLVATITQAEHMLATEALADSTSYAHTVLSIAVNMAKNDLQDIMNLTEPQVRINQRDAIIRELQYYMSIAEKMTRKEEENHEE